MIPLDLSLFGTDPWWLVLIKVVVLFVVLLVWTIFNVWYERRLVGKMQHRLGPIMNGPFGLLQAVADGSKLIMKEDFRPKSADRVLFTLAPLIAGTAAFTAWAVIPFGGEVEIFGVRTRLQATDLPISVLVILAVASVGIYGFVLAGWSSNSPYSLLGALRSSAQMISYELAMGMALVAVFLHASSMSTAQIVDVQGQPFTFFGTDFGFPYTETNLARSLGIVVAHRTSAGTARVRHDSGRHRLRRPVLNRVGRRPKVPLPDRRVDGTPLSSVRPALLGCGDLDIAVRWRERC